MGRKRRTKQDQSTPAEYLSQDQLHQLMTHLHDRADHARKTGATRPIVDELIVLLLVNAGLRAAELCSLNIADVPTAHGQDAIWVRDADGSVNRAVKIDQKTATRLERYVSLYRTGAKPNDPLLLNERGRRFIYMSLYSKLRKIAQNADLGPIHPHMLRRTYMVRLYDAERDLRYVQNQAGHANVATTAIYAKPHQVRPRPTKTVVTSTAASNPPPPPDKARECDVCARLVPARSATRIDSGQILCQECLKELRSSS
ncbi:MAG: tyrosine-type recombinase/integrase [Planctomycetota bacterium]